MTEFIKDVKKGDFQLEMIIDGEIFSKEIILKASYELVDKVYMFFQKQGKDFLVQFKLKDESLDLDKIVNSFGEELVFHDLRKQLEEKTGNRRDKIIETALGFSIGNEEIKNTIQDITEKLESYYKASDLHLTIEELEDIEVKIKSIIELMKKGESKSNINDDSIPSKLEEIITKMELVKSDDIDIKKYLEKTKEIKNSFNTTLLSYTEDNSKDSVVALESVYSNIWKMVEELINDLNRLEGKDVKEKKSIEEIIGEIKDDDDFSDEDKDEIIAILKDIED